MSEENVSGIKLFVYGTLMENEDAAHFLQHARKLQIAKTLPEFTLVDFGPYPAVLPHGSTSIQGEIYLVDKTFLPKLDEYEGCPGDYHRIAIKVADGTEAEIYIWNNPQLPPHKIIHSGDWRSR